MTREIVQERAELAKENRALRLQVDEKLRAAAFKLNVLAIVLTLFVVVATALGLVFQAASSDQSAPDSAAASVDQ